MLQTKLELYPKKIVGEKKNLVNSLVGRTLPEVGQSRYKTISLQNQC